MRVKEGMWALPYYSTDTAYVSVSYCATRYFLSLYQTAKWAIVTLDKTTKSCCCSCPHAEKLSKMKQPDLKCWHLCYLQDHDEVPQEMHVCVFTPAASEDSGSDNESESEEEREDNTFGLDK